MTEQDNDKSIDFDFEKYMNKMASQQNTAMETQTDIRMNESHSVACGNDDIIGRKPTASISTDARDMVKQFKEDNHVSAGCNTNDINTEEKVVDAIVKTNEIGSQCADVAKKEFKEVMCNTKINTESQACQKDTIGDSKEVSCLILKPEEINQINSEECIENLEDLPECFRCDGKKINKKGLPCKKCNGTGRLNNKFFKDLHKILADEVKKYCTSQYQKLLIKMLADKKEAQSKVVHEHVTCDNCLVKPIVGIRYKCSFRPDYDLCEKCEKELQPLQYAMVKIRQPTQAPVHLMCKYEEPAQ